MNDGHSVRSTGDDFDRHRMSTVVGNPRVVQLSDSAFSQNQNGVLHAEAT